MDEPWLPTFAQLIVEELRTGKIQDKVALHRAKGVVARKLKTERMPQDPELLAQLSDEDKSRFGPLLRKKPMRSQSGVAIIAVMSSPAGCPHGKCIYCPGGPEVDAPQSYTGFEPSTMRAKQFGYDPYKVTRHRLASLERNGHAIDKLEVVVQGGTFPARSEAYQDWFIHQIYQAANDGPLEDPDAGESEQAWHLIPSDERAQRLQDIMRANESADCRVIGLTVETKPDWCFEEHVDGMLRRGATRIELGIQTLDEETTRLTNRGHTVADSAKALQVARDAGFKVCVHMMPGLPRPTGAAGRARVDAVESTQTDTSPTGAAGRARVDAVESTQTDTSPTGAAGRARVDAVESTQTDTSPTGAAGRARVDAVESTQTDTSPTGAAGRARVDAVESTQTDTSPTGAAGRARVDAVESTQTDTSPTGAAGRARVDAVESRPGLDTTAETLLHPTSRAMDIEDMRRLFDEPEWRPDMLKIYPTLVVEDGETTLKKWWKDGTFEPLDTAHAIDVVAESLRFVPEYCRIQRIDRDIPTTHVEAGVMNSNLRQLAEAEALQRGIALRDIRAREVGTRIREGVLLDSKRVVLVRREYEASGGTEVFLSFEDPEADALVAFIRVRHVGPSHRSEFEGDTAVVRELKVYGVAQGIGIHDDPETGAWQHQGFGARLLQAAEDIAFGEWHCGRLLVIAGPGVKAYYRRHGFSDTGPYVAKEHP